MSSTCSMKSTVLCGEELCQICINRSFYSFDSKTKKNKLKVKCLDKDKNNSNIDLKKIFKCSHQKIWFKCDECDHSFHIAISHVTSKDFRWCPYCSGRKLCDDMTCNSCYLKSFKSYRGKTKKLKFKVNCWDNEKNLNITPRNSFLGTHKKFWFKCDMCNHSFNASLANITKKVNPRWCPYCPELTRKLCDDSECLHCYKKSFESYTGKTAKQKLKKDCWVMNKNNNIKPRHISKKTNKPYWFQCDGCNHYFKSIIGNVTDKNRWCPYCCQSPKLCDDNNCGWCYDKSLMSFKGTTIKGKLKINCWDYQKNTGLTPRDVTIATPKKYWFICDECYESFSSRICTITRHNNWCPICRNKTEKKFLQWFNKNYSTYILKYQVTYQWLKNPDTDNNLPFDFVVEQLKLIIEIDGEQHFSQVSVWNSPENTFEYDQYKMQKALEKGYTIIRLLQNDIWNNKNNWQKTFHRHFHSYNDPIVICVGCTKKYEKYLAIKKKESDVNTYHCSICDKTFKFNRTLQRHLSKYHYKT